MIRAIQSFASHSLGVGRCNLRQKWMSGTTLITCQQQQSPMTLSLRVCSTNTANTKEDTDIDDDKVVGKPIVDYYQVLGLSKHHFDINMEELKNNYRNLMAELHPDRHVAKSIDEKQVLEQQASQVTEAYQILKYPHQRAIHLLTLVNHPMEETSKGDLVGTTFLMEIMEFREHIESVSQNDDEEQQRMDFKELVDTAKEEMNQIYSKLDTAFETKDYNAALVLSAKLQYWNRIEETIQEKM